MGEGHRAASAQEAGAGGGDRRRCATCCAIGERPGCAKGAAESRQTSVMLVLERVLLFGLGAELQTRANRRAPSGGRACIAADVSPTRRASCMRCCWSLGPVLRSIYWVAESAIVPVDIVFYPDRALVVTTGSGVVTEEELLAYWQKDYANERIPWGAPEILDLRAVECFGVTSAGLRRLVELDAEYAKQQHAPSRLAIVAPSDLIFGMSRMYQMFSELNPNSIRVFRDLSDAEEWLGTSLRPA